MLPRHALIVSKIALSVLAAGFVAGCENSSDNWGFGVVKQSGIFGASETVVAIPKPTAGPRQFQCSGPFAPNTTAVNLAADFGQDNVVNADVAAPGGGSSSPGVVVLPNDPALAMEISFKNPSSLASPRRISFTEESAWTVNGIGIGTSLADLEKANGGPFRIQGFGGASGGVVADWRNGKFANIGGGCRLGVQLALPATLDDGALGKISGPRRLSSTDADVRAANPTVGVFWINYR